MSIKRKTKSSVAMVLPSFFPLPVGGSERQAFELAKSLINNDVKVVFFTPRRENTSKYENIEGIDVFRFSTPILFFKKIIKQQNNEQAAPRTYPKVRFDYSSLSGDDLIYAKARITAKSTLGIIDLFLGMLFGLLKKRRKFNIIQINTVTNFAVLGALSAKILGKRAVIKDSTMDGIIQMSNTPFPDSSRRFLTRNAFFVAMTAAIKNNYLKAGIPQDKITTIPNGIKLNTIPTIEHTPNKKCLFVGNLTQQPAKGIDILLSSWAIVIKQEPKATLTIIGDGDIAQYQNYVAGLGFNDSITFTGKASPQKYYQDSEIFILPSRREGMSNALMEAMAYGLKIVATDISGNQDLIEDRVSGVLVKPNDVNSLADGIIYMLSNTSPLFAEKARKNISDICAMEKVSSQYAHLYSTLIA